MYVYKLAMFFLPSVWYPSVSKSGCIDLVVGELQQVEGYCWAIGTKEMGLGPRHRGRGAGSLSGYPSRLRALASLFMARTVNDYSWRRIRP
jgi:hypothetical protein